MDRIAELLGRLADLTDDELAELESLQVAAFREAEPSDPTADNVAVITALADGLEAVRAEQTRRAEVTAELAAQRELAVARAQAAAEPPVVEPESEVVAEAEAATKEAAAPVTAASPSLAAVAAAQPQAARLPARTAPVSIVAAADIPGVALGQTLSGMDEIADAFVRKLPSMRSTAAGGDGEKVLVASVVTTYPEDRLLSQNDPYLNARRIQAVTDPAAIVAAGGVCAPLAPRYDLLNLSTTDRPVRDGLPGFGGERGGVTFMSPPKIGDLAGAIGIWTNANDTTPTAPTTKPVIHVNCGAPVSVYADAITARLRFGNMGARAYPEQVAINEALLMSAQARVADARLVTQIDAASTAVTAGPIFGAARDLLFQMGAAAMGYRSRNRMAPDATLRVLLPFWVRGLIRGDLTRQEPGDQVLGIDDSEIDSYLADRHLNPIWTLDAQVFGAQSAGVLLSYPSTVVWRLFAEGSFIFVDGGRLDVGIVRDSTLNGLNDYETFAETFENVAFVGVESVKVTSTVIPDGTSGGPKNPATALTAASI